MNTDNLVKAFPRWSGGRRLLAAVVLVGSVAVGLVAVGGVLQLSAAGSDGSSSFVPMTPCRLMDTRAGSQVGPRGTPIGAGELYSAPVWGTNGNCVIPASATAVSLNVTFVGPTSAGFVTVYPPDKPFPGTSNLNFVAGQAPAPNGVTSPLSFDGKIGFFNAAGTVNLIADIVGYYEQSGSAPGGIVAGNCGAILRWDLPECKPATYATGDKPRGVAFDGTSIWVTNNLADTVSKINPATGTKTDHPVGDLPYAVAFDGTSIWVTNNGANTVSKINPATGAAIATYPTGDGPRGVAFDGTSIWVANHNDFTVSKINPATGTKTDYATGSFPHGVAFDGSSIWVTNFNDNTVSKIDPTTGVAIATYPTGNGPRGVTFDGTSIWVANQTGATVSKINPATGLKTERMVGNGPRAVAFDGSNIWVTNELDDTVSRINPTTLLGVIATYPTGVEPFAVTFDGSNIWITNQDADTVSKLVP